MLKIIRNEIRIVIIYTFAHQNIKQCYRNIAINTLTIWSRHITTGKNL